MYERETWLTDSTIKILEYVCSVIKFDVELVPQFLSQVHFGIE